MKARTRGKKGEGVTPLSPRLVREKTAEGKNQGFSRVSSNLMGRVGRVKRVFRGSVQTSWVGSGRVSRPDPRDFESLLTQPDPTREI